MKKLTYKIEINAPAEKVYQAVIDFEKYKQWTAAFNPTSHFEGNWQKGEKMYFIGINENGKREGMIAKIAENIPNEFISIHHYGILDGENEITEGPMVESWTPSFENYSFTEKEGKTIFDVEVDTNEDYVDYFDTTWPNALKKLKEISEN